MIDSFIDYLQFEKRFSKNTTVSYKTDLVQFQEYVRSAFSVENLINASHSMVRSWVVVLVEQQLDPSSINRKIACLRSFYKYLLKQELISINPTTKIRILKTAKRLPHFVLENDMAKMFNATPIVSENSFAQIRDLVVMELLYGTGIRLSELITLRISQINLQERTLKVMGKRNKERVIPYTRQLAQLFQNYLSARQLKGHIQHDYLIVTDDGSIAYPMFIQRIVRKMLNLYSSVEKKSPHVMRHTYATHLLNKGAEINAVKELLGHSSLAATQVYTHNSMEKLKKVFGQAHPKA